MKNFLLKSKTIKILIIISVLCFFIFSTTKIYIKIGNIHVFRIGGHVLMWKWSKIIGERI